jgi:hypothetical protein
MNTIENLMSKIMPRIKTRNNSSKKLEVTRCYRVWATSLRIELVTKELLLKLKKML